MERVVITGMGVVSCIGNSLESVSSALRHARSGIRYMPEYEALGLRSRVAGVPDLSDEPAIDRKHRRFMGPGSIYAYYAMRKAIEDAGMTASTVSDPRTALVVGSGTASPHRHDEALQLFRAKGLDRLLPYYIPQIMGSTAPANLAHVFGITGPSYSITAACATSAYCIGNAFDMIRHGIVDRAFVGGAEEVSWATAVLFEAMGALSTKWNDQPHKASRPFDRDRDGFVAGGGAGILLLESERSALRRGARIHAEMIGFGAATQADDMVQPEMHGPSRAMRKALLSAGDPRIDYLNPHATSTPAGDAIELSAIRAVFEEGVPLISATKGLTGHTLGACSAHEAIFSVLMMNQGFVPASANLETPDEQHADMPVIRHTISVPIDVCMSNSIGFGGANASIVLAKHSSVFARN